MFKIKTSPYKIHRLLKTYHPALLPAGTAMFQDVQQTLAGHHRTHANLLQLRHIKTKRQSRLGSRSRCLPAVGGISPIR